MSDENPTPVNAPTPTTNTVLDAGEIVLLRLNALTPDDKKYKLTGNMAVIAKLAYLGSRLKSCIPITKIIPSTEPMKIYCMVFQSMGGLARCAAISALSPDIRPKTVAAMDSTHLVFI